MLAHPSPSLPGSLRDLARRHAARSPSCRHKSRLFVMYRRCMRAAIVNATNCRCRSVTELMPKPVYPSGLASPSAMALVMCQKYVEACPCIGRSSTVCYTWPRETTANWMIYGALFFRTINCTESCHPYAGGYWPSGHIIGYEHTFINLAKELMDGISKGYSPSPNFEDGVNNQIVLDSVEKSVQNGSWVNVS